jgi:hypothetical protein
LPAAGVSEFGPIGPDFCFLLLPQNKRQTNHLLVISSIKCVQ